ncbi:Microsomal glutathione S-transferase 3 [Mortierella hygrophila]|uniref:Glutathione S-transferase 3, mitochondrial n=1 Tax=Mortierella hygrophila TaxID=979708 RepID=A0A9P6K4S8_9FUNG|nr:Microsomal glutathione S-transferase 3 [Mortierella hygrophila]
MASITLTADYGYTIAVSVVSSVLVTFLGARVGSYRKEAGVPLPTMYAEEAEAKKDKKKLIFNCKQRVHQNTLEGFTSYMVTLLLAGARYPVAAPILGLIWCAGRLAYSYGYTSGNPEKRVYGSWGHIGDLGLVGLNIKMAFDLINA